MVGVPGLEPGTSSLSGTRSNQLSYTPSKVRTLTCVPLGGGITPWRNGVFRWRRKMVEPGGLEPPTTCLQSRRSGQLSYDPASQAET